MQKLPRFILISAALSLVTALSAQPPGRGRGPGGFGGPGGPGGPGRGPGGHPIVRVLDADQDHELSAGELANAPAALKALDTNGDGTISADELRPPRPADAPTPPADRRAPPADGDHPRPVDPIMLALDADNDGTLSAVEIANATTSLQALDANTDGKLTPDELMPLPPEGAPNGGRGHHHGRPPADGAN